MTLPINQIICGDNVETLATFPDGCIDLTVTSPPCGELRTYGGHSWDFEGVAQQLYRVTKPGGVVVWVVADQTIDGSESGESFRQALRFMEIGFRLHDTMIYKKQAVGACGSNKAYWQEWEFMFVLAKGEPTTINRIADRRNVTAGTSRSFSPKCEQVGTRQNRNTKIATLGIRGNVWEYATGMFNGDDKTKHEAPFPEAIARDHILSWSNEGDTVLDPFAGSGTTARKAKDLGRNWIAVEVNPGYCEIIRKRLAQQVLNFTEEAPCN